MDVLEGIWARGPWPGAQGCLALACSRCWVVGLGLVSVVGGWLDSGRRGMALEVMMAVEFMAQERKEKEGKEMTGRRKNRGS